MFLSSNGNALNMFEKWYVLIKTTKKTSAENTETDAFHIRFCSVGVIRVNGLRSVFLYHFIYLHLNKYS